MMKFSKIKPEFIVIFALLVSLVLSAVNRPSPSGLSSMKADILNADWYQNQKKIQCRIDCKIANYECEGQAWDDLIACLNLPLADENGCWSDYIDEMAACDAALTTCLAKCV